MTYLQELPSIMDQSMRIIHPKNMKFIGFDLLLWLWALAAISAAIAHILMPNWTATGTMWPPSVHWQREIAYFDIFIGTVFIWAARQHNLNVKRNVMLLLCFLSIALGENHLEGWIAGSKVFHVMFTVANFLAALWAGLVCWHYRMY